MVVDGRTSSTRSGSQATYRDKSFAAGDVVTHVLDPNVRAAIIRIVFKRKTNTAGQARRLLLLVRLNHDDTLPAAQADLAKQAKELLFPGSWDSYVRVPKSPRGWPKGVNENDLSSPRKSMSVNDLMVIEKVSCPVHTASNSQHRDLSRVHFSYIKHSHLTLPLWVPSIVQQGGRLRTQVWHACSSPLLCSRLYCSYMHSAS